MATLSHSCQNLSWHSQIVNLPGPGLHYSAGMMIQMRPLEGKKIMIDPGHGGPDPGAIGQAGAEEEDVALSMSEKLKEDLTALGAEVRLTRTTDSAVLPGGSKSEDLQERCSLSNRWGADLFISMHCNSAENHNAVGTETYHARNASSKSKIAARLVQNQTAQLLPNRGVKQANFHVIVHTNAPAILVETAFISNRGEEALLVDNGFQDRFCEHVAAGVANYLTMAESIKTVAPRPDPGEMDDESNWDPEKPNQAGQEYLLAG